MRWVKIALSALGLLAAAGASFGEAPPAAAQTGPGDGAALAAEEPGKPKNTVRWTTASEMDNFGFDVYRSSTKDGKYKRMTKKPIAGAGTIDTPTKYIWVDETIDPTQEYWYYVESISMDGHREPFTPKILATAKIKP